MTAQRAAGDDRLDVVAAGLPVGLVERLRGLAPDVGRVRGVQPRVVEGEVEQGAVPGDGRLDVTRRAAAGVLLGQVLADLVADLLDALHQLVQEVAHDLHRGVHGAGPVAVHRLRQALGQVVGVELGRQDAPGGPLVGLDEGRAPLLQPGHTGRGGRVVDPRRQRVRRVAVLPRHRDEDRGDPALLVQRHGDRAGVVLGGDRPERTVRLTERAAAADDVVAGTADGLHRVLHGSPCRRWRGCEAPGCCVSQPSRGRCRDA